MVERGEAVYQFRAAKLPEGPESGGAAGPGPLSSGRGQDEQLAGGRSEPIPRGAISKLAQPTPCITAEASRAELPASAAGSAGEATEPPGAPEGAPPAGRRADRMRQPACLGRAETDAFWNTTQATCLFDGHRAEKTSKEKHQSNQKKHVGWQGTHLRRCLCCPPCSPPPFLSRQSR